MKGPLTATFTWSDPNDTDYPSVLVIKETGVASWTGDSGTATTGLPNETINTGAHGQSKSGYQYTIKQNPGAGFSLPAVNIKADATLGAGSTSGLVNASASVGYVATYTPVTIESNYAVRTGRAFNFLVGQEADFYVSAGGYQLDQHQWYSGAPHVDIVRLLDNFARETIRDAGQTIQEHPSWYYDGGDYQGQTSCSVRIKNGSTVLGTVSVYRYLNVYRPTVQVPGAVGPSTINDPAMGSQGNEEAMAGSKALVKAGMAFVGKMKLPPLFVQAQGLGKWSYAQLASTAYSVTFVAGGSEQKSFPMGLDNVYPYGGSVVGSGTNSDWCDTTYAYEFIFADSPAMGIGDCSAASRSFSGKPFVVLRPPVYAGQGRVDMPIKKAEWNSAMNSSRNASLDWQPASGYTLYPAVSLSETTPYGAGVTLDSLMQDALYSEDMDWHTVLENQQ